MKNKWIKKGDKVLILSGNDRGRVGEVIGKKESRILVQGVNIRTIHMKARQQGETSKIVNMEKPIHISNVALCDADGNKLKLKVKIGKDGSKELVYTSGDKEVSYRILKRTREGIS